MWFYSAPFLVSSSLPHFLSREVSPRVLQEPPTLLARGFGLASSTEIHQQEIRGWEKSKVEMFPPWSLLAWFHFSWQNPHPSRPLGTSSFRLQHHCLGPEPANPTSSALGLQPPDKRLFPVVASLCGPPQYPVCSLNLPTPLYISSLELSGLTCISRSLNE